MVSTESIRKCNRNPENRKKSNKFIELKLHLRPTPTLLY